LEDTFQLVDGVVANVDQIVSDSARLAQHVGRDVRRLSESQHADTAPCAEPLPDAAERLARVQAWNEVVLNLAVPCTRCGAELPRGGKAYLGLSDDATAPRAWLCAEAVESLGEDGD
jgi:hypothetical protein